MSIQFDNATPYEALRTDTLDQHGERFHIVTVKLSYRIDAKGLVDDPDATPIQTDDTPYGELNRSSIEFESDLAPFKPRTDVIVNAIAYAPEGKPVQRFQVRLWVGLPDTPAPLPPQPQGLNQFTMPSKVEMEKWHKAVEQAKKQTIPGQVYINKTLTVTGPRSFQRNNIVSRLVDGAAMIGTMGMVRSNPWSLTVPEGITHLPIRYEYAFGGQSRMQPDDPVAKDVPEKNWLTHSQIEQHPDKQTPPIAHTAFEFNPVGCGYCADWYLFAKQPERVAAPQIEHPNFPITADLFWDVARGKTKNDDLASLAQGFGFVGRAWQPRRGLIGTIDEKTEWGEDEIPQLPKEFDFGYWNGAPRDQQTPHLTGNEIIELTNLCTPEHPSAHKDEYGNTILRFELPGDCFYLALGDKYGRIGMKLLELDTLAIDPEKSKVDVVWRGAVSSQAQLRNMELRVNRAHERQVLNDLLKVLRPDLLDVQNSSNGKQVVHG